MGAVNERTEPPPFLQPPIFMIGRDSKGNWVAQEESGARGGLFIDRAEALKFAKFESGDRLHAVVWVAGILELDTHGAPATKSDEQPADDSFSVRQRWAA